MGDVDGSRALARNHTVAQAWRLDIDGVGKVVFAFQFLRCVFWPSVSGCVRGPHVDSNAMPTSYDLRMVSCDVDCGTKNSYLDRKYVKVTSNMGFD